MNQNEFKYFKGKEAELFDASSLPTGFLLKSLFIKARRKSWGKVSDARARFVWTVNEVSDTSGPAATVRDYRERQTIRGIIKPIAEKYPLKAACEVGCGYGRVTMVLKEFAGTVVGFEREAHLVNIAKRLMPEIDFCRVEGLDKISSCGKGRFDLVMTCTVLQHLTDEHCRSVIEEMKRICPEGHVLIIEKTDDFATTKNFTDGNSFMSRGRSPEQYSAWMKPYKLVSVSKRVVETGYYNPNPGTCMLFASPSLEGKRA